MGWKVWGDPWMSGQLSNTDLFQTMTFNNNYILKAIRTWVIVYNNPVFTNLRLHIYSNEVVDSNNTVKKYLATSSNTLTKAQIITLENGVKEIPFLFDDFPVQANTDYNFVINGDGYLPTTSSYLAWMKAFPDPVYSSNYTPELETLPFAPYQIYAIGGLY